MKTFLVPTDFSTEAQAALDVALELASPDDVVVLLHVYSLLFSPRVLAPEKMHEIDRRVNARLAELTTHASSVSSVRIEATSRTGDATETILDWARDRRPTAIVLGTHGRGRVAAAIVGSVAQRVLHEAPTQVVVVRPKRA